MTVVLGLKSYPQSWCHVPTLFSEISKNLMFAPLVTLVTSSRVSPIFSVWPDQQSQCNSAMTVISSWSWYVKSYEAEHRYELPSPTNAHSNKTVVSGSKSYPQNWWSHAYLIFRNKWDISCFAPLMTLVTSSRVSPTFYVWHDQQSSVYLNYDSHVILKLIFQKLWSKHCYKLPSPTNAKFWHDSSVRLKELPSKLVSHAYLISEISEISQILHLWWLLVTSSRVSPTFSVWHDQRSSVYLTMTVMSSWSQYLRSYEAKCCYDLPSPTNAQFWHDSWCWTQRATLKVVSHAYLIFRNKWELSHFAPLMTFGDFQQGFTNFLCLTWSAVISVTQLWHLSSWSRYINSYEANGATASQPTNAHFWHDSCVSSKSYPQNWSHMPTLFSEISEISHVLHLWWLLMTSSRVSPTSSLTWQWSSV